MTGKLLCLGLGSRGEERQFPLRIHKHSLPSYAFVVLNIISQLQNTNYVNEGTCYHKQGLAETTAGLKT